MLNSKLLQRVNATNLPKSRSRSIYRGNKSHTASMHLKIECDMSPETVRRPKEQQSCSKQLMKENKTQLIRESLRIVEGSFSGKKSQREVIGEKANKNAIMLQARHLETERTLKQTTNLVSRKESWLKPENSLKPEKTSMATIKIASKKEEKLNEQQVAISEEELKNILMTMKQLEIENRRLRKEIKLHLGWPKSSVAMAL